MDCSPLGSSVHGISQARILEWVVISSSRGSSWPSDWTQVSWISCRGQAGSLPTEPPQINRVDDRTSDGVPAPAMQAGASSLSHLTTTPTPGPEQSVFTRPQSSHVLLASHPLNTQVSGPQLWRFYLLLTWGTHTSAGLHNPLLAGRLWLCLFQWALNLSFGEVASQIWTSLDTLLQPWDTILSSLTSFFHLLS